MERLQKLHSKDQKLIVGLISGTSLDGVDAALVKIKGQGTETKVELLHFLTYRYPDGLKEVILENSTPGQGRVEDICRLNFLLGEIFAQATMSLLEAAGYKTEEVDLIGSHGQTIHHLPEEEMLFDYKIRSTLQLGEPSVIAKRTGIITVADFRPADMAVGGEGAPLVPYFDFVLFHSTDKNRCLLNIGGIANFTVLKNKCRVEEVMAFDTGPGNMVIDALMQKLFQKPFDEQGRTALSGQVSKELLRVGLEHSFFKKPPPKSTGREEFGESFCNRFLTEGTRLNLKPEDIISTASELTVETIWQSYQNFVLPVVEFDELIISGGGTENQYIMESLRNRSKDVAVKAIDDFGIPSEAKEAVCFAVLANETISGSPNNVPNATGASRQTILGKICF
jgi:anhydro-N-acetylmuramic acid kinase